MTGAPALGGWTSGGLLGVTKTQLLSGGVGSYLTVHVFGIALNLDTIYGSLIAALAVAALGLAVRRSATAGVPGRLQLMWEAVLGAVERQVASSIGPESGPVIPLAVTIFFFVLFSNWLEILPTGSVAVVVPSPSADVNLTYAMALFVFGVYNVAGIRRRGVRGFVGKFFKPYAFLFPINLIEEIAKPLTLALRLFGNLFSGGLMIAILAALFPAYLSWLPTLVWKPFDMFIGVIQAFIFALLTILYYEAAVSSEGH